MQNFTGNRRPRSRRNNNGKMYFWGEWGMAESHGIVASNEATEPALMTFS
jgi:hypothetical protein